MSQLVELDFVKARHWLSLDSLAQPLGAQLLP